MELKIRVIKAIKENLNLKSKNLNLPGEKKTGNKLFPVIPNFRIIKKSK